MAKNTTKKVRAWAVVIRESGMIENADALVSQDCCCCEETKALAIYATKKEAKTMCWYKATYDIVPIEIALITSKKKGR